MTQPAGVGDVREKITDFFWKLHTGAINTENMNLEEQDIFKADSIVSFIKESGWVKLAKDQTYPDDYDDTIFHTNLEKAAGLIGFGQGQESLWMAGWRKIE